MEKLQNKLWANTWIIAFLVAFFWLEYVIFLYSSFTLLSLASILAGTSGVLLALSFSLSSLGYYFDLFDRWIVYRKYLGLSGYYLALLYTVLVITLNPQFYLTHFGQNIFGIDMSLGFLAMFIFTGMAIISNNTMMLLIGPKLWRQLLGLGYIAYAILIVRAILLDSSKWIEWIASDFSLPPIRLILTVLGLIVLLFRASVPFHKAWFNKIQTSISS